MMLPISVNRKKRLYVFRTGLIRLLFFHISLIFLTLFPLSIYAEMPAVDYQNTILTGPQTARIAVDIGGNVYVSDPRLRTVKKYNPLGNLKMTISNVLKPLGVAVDRSGNIYIGDDVKDNVSVYDPSGNFFRKLGGGDGEVTMPNDIAIDLDTGNVYVSDSGKMWLRYMVRTGRFSLR